MRFETYQTPDTLCQYVELETNAFVFTDAIGITAYDTKPSQVDGKRVLNDTEYPAMTQDWHAFTAGEKGYIKDYLRQLYNAGIIELAVDSFEELEGLIDDMPIYSRTSWPMQTYSTSPLRLQSSGSGRCGGANSLLAPALNDIINMNPLADTRVVNFGETQFTNTAFIQCPVLLNLLARATDEELISPSDDIKKWIDENIIPVATNTSAHWDVYFNFSKEYLFINKISDVLFRWSCEAVNKATPEFLALHPDYLYRADNTVIHIKVDDSKVLHTDLREVTTKLYGDLQFSCKVSDLQAQADVAEWAKIVGSLIPFVGTGDVYVYLWLTFEDGTNSGLCIQQIPINSVTEDVTNLYHRNGNDGSTVTAHYGIPAEGVDPSVIGWDDSAYDPWTDDTFTGNPSRSDFIGDSGTNSNISLLTRTYACTESQIKQVGAKIWSGVFTSLIDTINSSPIQNIISVKAFPFPIGGGTDAEIVLGNVELGITAHELPANYSPIKTIGTFTVPQPHKDTALAWLDYAPYTTLQMYLPYVGIVTLDNNKVLGKTCTLKYIYDVICGNCQACLYVDGIEIGKWSGEIAIDIPITASNRVQQGASYITGGIKMITDIMSQSWASLATDAINTAMSPFRTQTTGTPSSACDSFDHQNAYLIIDRPVYDEPSNYGHLYGYPCNAGRYLNGLHGYTQCDDIHIEGVPCTEEEREILTQLLKEGVYL